MMNKFDRRRYEEHTRSLLCSDEFTYLYYLTLNLQNKPTRHKEAKSLGFDNAMERYIAGFCKRLCKTINRHLITIVGYNDVVGHRKPHAHIVIASSVPISKLQVLKAGRNYHKHGKIRSIHFQKYFPSLRGWSYTEKKHTYFPTAMFHHRSRCCGSHCAVLKRFNQRTRVPITQRHR